MIRICGRLFKFVVLVLDGLEVNAVVVVLVLEGLEDLCCCCCLGAGGARGLMLLFSSMCWRLMLLFRFWRLMLLLSRCLWLMLLLSRFLKFNVVVWLLKINVVVVV